MRQKGSLLCLAALFLLLAACQPAQAPGEDFYQPPVPGAAFTPAPVLPEAASPPGGSQAAAPTASAPPLPTPTPFCSPGLSFLEDLTIPDGSVFTPGSPLDKRWRVRNSGTCNWDERYRVRLVAGPDLGARPEQALYPARSGVEADIRLLLTAPAEPGPYRSAWQAYGPDGQPFGDPFFIDFVVVAQ